MTYELKCGDVLEQLRLLDTRSVQTVVTSPPYWGLRDYGVAGQIGLEPTPDAYVANLVKVFRELNRVLMTDGTLWLNLGDSYAAHPGQRKSTDAAGAKQITNRGAQAVGSRTAEGVKAKDLIGIPWRVAFALQADGWYLRSDIIWHKPNPMPESVTDRPTKAHEYLFLLTKSDRYYYDHEAVQEDAVCDRKRGPALHGDLVSTNGNGGLSQREPGQKRNRRSVWTVATQSYRGAHFATMPEKLVEPCILAGSTPDDIVLDPFVGSGTVGVVALHHGRRFIGIDLNEQYLALAHARIAAGSKKLTA